MSKLWIICTHSLYISLYEYHVCKMSNLNFFFRNNHVISRVTLLVSDCPPCRNVLTRIRTRRRPKSILETVLLLTSPPSPRVMTSVKGHVLTMPTAMYVRFHMYRLSCPPLLTRVPSFFIYLMSWTEKLAALEIHFSVAAPFLPLSPTVYCSKPAYVRLCVVGSYSNFGCIGQSVAVYCSVTSPFHSNPSRSGRNKTSPSALLLLLHASKPNWSKRDPLKRKKAEMCEYALCTKGQLSLVSFTFCGFSSFRRSPGAR